MLAELQAQFQAAVLSGSSPGALLRGSEQQRARGLQAYRIAYPARLQEALQDNYGVLHQALGDEAFGALAQAYLQAQPPTEPNIRCFGHRLADFMAQWPELPHPALVDLARLDWALRAAFDAGALPALQLDTLAATPPDQWGSLTLHLQPHAQLLALQWAVGPAWHALADAREAGQEAELPEPQPLAHSVLIWREALSPQWRSVQAQEALALQQLSDAPSLALWLERGGEAQLGQRVAWLQTWLAGGLLIG